MLNKVQLIGRLTGAPEPISNGCSFTVAVNESYKDKEGNNVENTEFVRCVAFGKLSEILLKWLEKGEKHYFEGKLRTSKYEKDGETRYSTSVVVNNFSFLDAKKKDKNETLKNAEEIFKEDEKKEEIEQEVIINDLPF